MRGWNLALACFFLFGLALATFYPALQNGFINYDDDLYITGNAHVQEGLTIASIAWAMTSLAASNWHPLAWLSHMADCQCYGLQPAGHHFTSVLLHSVNTVLLFLALRRLTGAGWRSLFVAAVFGVHPLRVESVAWVSERKDVLSMLFGLLALLMYANYAERSRTRTPKAMIFYGLALLFFLFSLMSKPMLVTLPFVLLLLDFWPLARFKNKNAGKLILEKLPFLFLAALSCAVTFAAQKSGGAMKLMAGMPLQDRLENVPVSYCRYLGEIFWPENLAVIYPAADHWPLSIVICSIVILLGLTLLTILALRTAPWLATGWFWFLGALVPVIGLVAVGEQSMADRYTYFPMIGILIMLAWSAERMTRNWRHRVVGLSTVSMAIIIACILVTRHNLVYWQSSETLFRHVIAVTTDNYSAHCNLGNALLAQGRADEALAEFQTAVKLKPGSPENHINLGVALAGLDRMQEALAEFQTAARLEPNNGLAHHNLGMALERLDQLEAATQEYREAVRLLPDYAPAHNSLGVALAKKNLLDEAIVQFQEAVRLDPANLATQNNLKMALGLKGR